MTTPQSYFQILQDGEENEESGRGSFEIHEPLASPEKSLRLEDSAEEYSDTEKEPLGGDRILNTWHMAYPLLDPS